MDREIGFLIYCLEQYKNAKGLTGRQVMDIFSRYRLTEYIVDCFEALHTTGDKYIVADIDQYIAARRPVN